MPSALRSSQLEVSWNPGITRCSRVLVCTIESINSSRVRSLATEGDLRTKRTAAAAAAACWPAWSLWLLSWLCEVAWWWCMWPLRPRPPESSRKLSRMRERTGATVSRYLNSSILDGERLMLLRYGGRVLENEYWRCIRKWVRKLRLFCSKDLYYLISSSWTINSYCTAWFCLVAVGSNF